MCVVRRVHVKRMRGSNVCGGEGTCEKDKGAYVCMYIQHGRCVYTYMYVYTTLQVRCSIHTDHHLYVAHTHTNLKVECTTRKGYVCVAVLHGGQIKCVWWKRCM